MIHGRSRSGRRGDQGARREGWLHSLLRGVAALLLRVRPATAGCILVLGTPCARVRGLRLTQDARGGGSPPVQRCFVTRRSQGARREKEMETAVRRSQQRDQIRSLG